MRIGVDVMGGDNAPSAILEGAINALEKLEPGDELFLAGPRDVIEQGLSEKRVDDPRIQIVDCSEVIDMAEPPVEAVRNKKDSTIAVLARMSSRRSSPRLDGMISAGNTGACVTAAQ